MIQWFTAPATVHATKKMLSRKYNLYIIRMSGSISSVKPRWWRSNTFRLSSSRYVLLSFVLKEVEVPGDIFIVICAVRVVLDAL